MIYVRPDIATQYALAKDDEPHRPPTRRVKPLPKTSLWQVLRLLTERGPWCPTCKFGLYEPGEHPAACCMRDGAPL